MFSFRNFLPKKKDTPRPPAPKTLPPPVPVLGNGPLKTYGVSIPNFSFKDFKWGEFSPNNDLFFTGGDSYIQFLYVIDGKCADYDDAKLINSRMKHNLATKAAQITDHVNSENPDILTGLFLNTDVKLMSEKGTERGASCCLTAVTDSNIAVVNVGNTRAVIGKANGTYENLHTLYTPDVQFRKREHNDAFLIVASDGLYSILSEEVVVNRVHEMLGNTKNKLKDVCTSLTAMATAYADSDHDDITVMIALLNQEST